MFSKIHPKAIVSPSSRIEEGVSVGPYAIIGDNVKLGAGTIIDSFSHILGNTEVGKNCHIFSHAVIGSIPQDLKYKGKNSFLIIGDNNCIREFVTINPGTEEGSKTVVGSGNLIMAYSHIAHDCSLGDGNILANAATLAGYVTIENKVVIGGLVAVHQFCRVGSLSIIGGCSKVVQDVPPYSMCDGHPACVYGLNLVGLRRANFSAAAIKKLKQAYKYLFFEGHSVSQACILVEKEFYGEKEIDCLLQFVKSSKRGINRKSKSQCQK